MNILWRVIEWLYLRAENNLAYYDQQTGCFNKNYFCGRCHTKYQDKNIYLIIVDIDNLKKLNDTRGHSYGDKVIKQVGKILLKLYPRPDEVCRYGGDEFVVFAKEYNDVTEELLRGLASIGVYQKSEFDSLEMAMELADRALYRKKEKGITPHENGRHSSTHDNYSG